MHRRKDLPPKTETLSAQLHSPVRREVDKFEQTQLLYIWMYRTRTLPSHTKPCRFNLYKNVCCLGIVKYDKSHYCYLI